MNTKMISIDWLSLYCLSCKKYASINDYEALFKEIYTDYKVRCLDLEENAPLLYKFELTPVGYGSKTFAMSFNVAVEYGGSLINFANVSMCPRSETIPTAAVIIKVSNFVLYKFHSYDLLRVMIEELLNQLNFKFVNVSRLDICADFATFDNGMKPTELIDYVCQGVVRRVSKNNRAKCTFVKAWNKAKNTYNWQYLRYGDHGAICSAYLYNKTEELKESGKGYIADAWKQCKLGELAENNDIWRLEFSIDGEFMKCCKLDEESITLRLILSSDFLLQYYKLMYSRLFDIRVVDNSKRVGKWERLDLMQLDEVEICISVDLTRKVIHSNRTDKIVLNYLMNLGKRIDKSGRVFDETEQKAVELLPMLAVCTRLGDWAAKKYEFVRGQELILGDQRKTDYSVNDLEEQAKFNRIVNRWSEADFV